MSGTRQRSNLDRRGDGCASRRELGVICVALRTVIALLIDLHQEKIFYLGRCAVLESTPLAKCTTHTQNALVVAFLAVDAHVLLGKGLWQHLAHLQRNHPRTVDEKTLFQGKLVFFECAGQYKTCPSRRSGRGQSGSLSAFH